MSRRGLVIGMVLLTVSCATSGGGAARPTPSPSPSPSAIAAVVPPTSPVSTGTSTGSFGLLIVNNQLELIDIHGKIAASTSIRPNTAGACAGGAGSVQAPPVSASADLVYFRDGDTKIRSLSLDGKTADVTTVPGGPTTVSFFSVSPDDKRIAVAVEDLSSEPVQMRLYVEDLVGATNHADIYTANAGGKGSLWPMGWHGTSLVLAVWPACSFNPTGRHPISWHVSDSATAVRLATIGDQYCVVSTWPSPAGVACVALAPDSQTALATFYDWAGKAGARVLVPITGSQSGVSPKGDLVFTATALNIGASSGQTNILPVGSHDRVTFPGHEACLWIDDTRLLAPDAVLDYPSYVITPISPAGICAGRFPGGL